jgi:PAS domain-containing protein
VTVLRFHFSFGISLGRRHTRAVHQRRASTSIRDTADALVEVSADGLAVLDAGLCFTQLNTSAAALLGAAA